MENNAFFVPTLNKQGFAAVYLDRFSKKFTEFEEGEFLEIGAAFGYTTLEALSNGASVTANDLEVNHLLHLEKEAKLKGFDRLKTVAGEFPNQLVFQENRFKKILISRVLHFFTGQQIKNALQTVVYWLQPGGEVIIVCETPYLKNWTSFLDEYKERSRSGIEFPGEISNPQYWENNRTENLPVFVHWLDKDILETLVIGSGLEVVDVAYIDRSGQFPSDLLLDGRESVGIIGRKI